MTRNLFEIGAILLYDMNGKSSTEKACSLSWFQGWNESQREQFAQALLEKDRELSNPNPTVSEESLDSLMQTLGSEIKVTSTILKLEC